MDLSWGSLEAGKFVTNVGLITSNGPYGQNIMAAEWTHHVSYKPELIMVNVGFDKATEANILKTKEFGVNLAAFDQNVAASIAGGSSGKHVDKIKVLRDFGVEFYKAKKINVLMVKGAALNAECILVKQKKLGDHNMLIGEVVEVSSIDKQPLIYSSGKYWAFGQQVQKPSQDVLDRIQKLVERHKKISSAQD